MAESARIRVATSADIDALCDLAAVYYAELQETPGFNDLGFDRDVIATTVEGYLAPGFIAFIVELEGDIVGVLLARVSRNMVSSKIVVFEEFFYLKPCARGRFIFVRLMNHFLFWAKATGAVCVHMGIDSPIVPERTAKLLSFFGFKQTGSRFMRAL